MSARPKLAAFVLFAAVAGCSPTECPPPEALKPTTKAEKPPKPEVEPGTFGGTEPGFVEWFSADGDTVLLRRFYKDTNGDGEVTARLGDHGEVVGDDPVVEVHDLVRGTVEIFDEVLATGPRQRSLVLRRGDVVELLDTATDERTELPATHKGDDGNPCLPARQAVYGPGEMRIAFITKDDRPAVYEFSTRRIHVFEFVEGLWRVGAPPLDGGVIVQVVRQDTDGDGIVRPPRARTTCPSRWAAGFATSVGQYGWEGDAYEQRMVYPSGKSVAFEGTGVPVGEDAIWTPQGGVRALDGSVISPGERCEVVSVPLGENELLVSCGDQLGIWDPGGGAPRLLTEKARPTEPVSVPARPDASQAWVALEVETDEGTRLGRLDLRTARLDLGPLANSIGRPHSSGWVLASHRENGTTAYNLATGAATNVGAQAKELVGLTAMIAGKRYVIDPHTGAKLEAPDPPRHTSEAGCVVRATGEFPPFDRGPWRVDCPIL